MDAGILKWLGWWIAAFLAPVVLMPLAFALLEYFVVSLVFAAIPRPPEGLPSCAVSIPPDLECQMTTAWQEYQKGDEYIDWYSKRSEGDGDEYILWYRMISEGDGDEYIVGRFLYGEGRAYLRWIYLAFAPSIAIALYLMVPSLMVRRESDAKRRVRALLLLFLFPALFYWMFLLGFAAELP